MGWTVGPGRPTAVQRQATFLKLNALWLPDNRIRSRPIPWPRGRALANHISPLAQVFRGMADLIDHDHTSQTQYEAVTKAAEALAARATTQQLVAGPLWEADGAGLLAAAYAFHAGLPRQAATATHIQALVETSPAPTHGGDKAPRGDPTPIMAGNSAGRTAQPAPPPGPRATPVDPRRLPGPPLHHLDPADEAKLWPAWALPWPTSPAGHSSSRPGPAEGDWVTLRGNDPGNRVDPRATGEDPTRPGHRPGPVFRP
jgi:hypothetical protein